jgi:hypothetical protein
VASPQLPARADPELYNYLKFLRDRLTRLEKDAGFIAVDGAETDGGTTGEVYRDIAPTSLATGTATAAWTSVDVSAYVTDGATHVEIWAHIEIGSSGDQGSIDFGTDGSTVAKPGCKTMTAQSNVDTDSSTAVFRVPITSAKLFYYQVTGTLNTDAAWELQIVGEYASF